MKTDHSYSPRLKREDWRLLSVFHGYRLLLAFTITISVSLLADTGFFRSVDTQQFLAASLFYLFASGIVLLA
ncbi:MAG TPA: hypothetical protein VM532_07235, partial [Burkholderiales bacterium]|nr:hypothetical protein [Burkholderiales bacterium]